MMRIGDGAAARRKGARFWLPMAAAIAAAALLAGWLLHALLHGLQERERQRVELYWNGYASMYAELNGGWDGLQERLDRDAYLYAGESSFAVKVYAGDGDGEPIAALSRGGGADGGRKLPVLLRGEVAGYTQTSLKAHGQAEWIAYGVSGAVAGLLLAAGLALHRRIARSDAAAERRLAAELASHMARTRERLRGREDKQSRSTRRIDARREQRDGRTDAEQEGLLQLKREIDELLLRNYKLETVRRTMVADIAHELRTPIAIMRATLDHALQAGVPLAPEKTAALHDEVLRLGRLVRELQELALAESGHLPLFKSWFSLTELAREVLEALAAEGEERGIRHALTGFPDAQIYGDRSRIRQMLINLAGNAFRHARSLVTVDIALTGTAVMLTVGDDGIGIEEEELGRVFDRFYRGTEARKGTRERGTGLGLGLAIVREFARAHGGDAHVRSRYGEGASFIVRLPVMKE